MTNLQNDNIANALISGVMKAEQAAGNRQSQLVLYMFQNDVTYSKDELVKFFKVVGSDRTTLIEKAIMNISDDYEAALELRDTLANERKSDKDSFTASKALQHEQNNSKLRAANMLFIRAVTGCLHLRVIDAYDVKVKNTGAIEFMYDSKDKDGKPVKNSKGNPVAEKASMSGNALVRAGDKTIAEMVGTSKKKERTVSNPVKGGIAPTADVVANRVRIQTANGNGIEDMSDEEEKALNKLLHELLAAKFLDDKGQLDKATVLEYLEAEFPAKATKAPKAA